MQVGDALTRAFTRTDASFASLVLPVFKLGFWDLSKVGCCTIVAAVTPSHVIVANGMPSLPLSLPPFPCSHPPSLSPLFLPTTVCLAPIVPSSPPLFPPCPVCLPPSRACFALLPPLPLPSPRAPVSLTVCVCACACSG